MDNSWLGDIIQFVIHLVVLVVMFKHVVEFMDSVMAIVGGVVIMQCAVNWLKTHLNYYFFNYSAVILALSLSSFYLY